MDYGHILVAADFSEFSDSVIEFAFAFGRQCRARLTLAHVIEPFEEESDETIQPADYEGWARKEEAKIRQQAQPYLDKTGGDPIGVDFVLLRGFNPADALLELLGKNRFDLLLIGTHGRGGLKRFLQGRVAERMVRMSPIPVLTVHRSFTNFSISRVLVPIDFSIPSRSALDAAAEISRACNAKVILFHVIEQDIYPSFYSEGEETIFDIDRNLPRIVRENLEEFVADSLEPDLVEDYVVKKGLAHQEIVDYAQKNHIDLLVISSHGSTGMEYLLMGNTAEKVIRQATCPVLTVKSNA